MSRFVLIPGFPLDSRMWQAVADELRAGGHEVLCVDVGGLGESAIPSVAASIEAMADQVADAMEGAGWAAANIAGISMGGYVMMALLRMYPHLVLGLGLVSTRAAADSPTRRQSRLEQAATMNERGLDVLARSMSISLVSARAAHQGTAEQVRAWIGRQDPEAVAWCLRAMATRPDSLGTLRTAGARASVVVVGELDDISTVADAEQMVAALRDAGGRPTLSVLPDAGHLSACEAPSVVAGALTQLG